MLEPGTIFGKYEIVRCIGTGGMGSVYEATHSLLRKRVALKTLHPQLTAHFDFRARFLREGETLARIRHPNVVDISDVGVQDGLTYLVMEYLEGENLHTLLSRERSLDARRIANMMLPLIDGLGAAHAAGVVHRDIKPENIFLARDAKGEVRPKLLDFGISKVEGTPQSMALTSGGGVLGTPLYMSPEQARGSANVDWRSDEYALGVVLYECATGVLPFHHEALLDQMNAIVTGVYEHPCALKPDLSEDLAEVIIRAMSLEPSRRFDPLDALARALLPFATTRVRAYYEAIFAEDGPAPESIRPPVPAFESVSGVITLPPALTPTRVSRLVVPAGTTPVGTPQPAPNRDEVVVRNSSPTPIYPTPVASRPPAAVAEAAPPKRRRSAGVLVALLLLLGVAVAAFAWFRPDRNDARAATEPAPPAPALPAAGPSAGHTPAVAGIPTTPIVALPAVPTPLQPELLPPPSLPEPTTPPTPPTSPVAIGEAPPTSPVAIGEAPPIVAPPIRRPRVRPTGGQGNGQPTPAADPHDIRLTR